MSRGYQHEFSDVAKKGNKLFQYKERQQKANTMVKVISEYKNENISALKVLNVGGSAGIIDEYLSRHFQHVIGMDIDEKAIQFAKENFNKDNLLFEIGDAMDMKYDSNSLDIVICSQVYEHVQDAKVMMGEIFRVLKPNGIVYFAAGNRLIFNEPHYDLPFLSVIPRPLAHIYLKLTKKGNYYYEKHFTYWGLKKLAKQFSITDYTLKIIKSPKKYSAESMIKPGSKKQKIASFITKYFMWLVPGYIWILEKKEHH